jgi:hypothetical protein
MDDMCMHAAAPPPSIYLLVPVGCFLIGATFIGVYWPLDFQPDGGKGALAGAGWGPIGITWCWIIIWWFLADVAKYFIWKVRGERLVHALIGFPYSY